MSLYENIKIALEGLKLNKMRSFLTMLGIIIGIASVITIATMGEALTKSVSDGFEGMANALIEINVVPKDEYDWNSVQDKDYLDKYKIDKIKERFDDRIEEILLYGGGSSGYAVNGREGSNVNIFSVSPGEKKAFGIKMLSGRFLEEDDITEEKEVCVISTKVLEKLYENNPEKILGKEIRVDLPNGGFKYYYVVGIYKFEPVSFGVMGGESDDTPTSLYIPYTVGNTQFMDKEKDPDKYSYFSLLAKSREDVASLSKEIVEYSNQTFYKDVKNAEISSFTLEGQLSEIMQIMSTISLGIGGIAAISLLVGGIGVMNILLVSVTERTREIGIRKALGATNKDIRSQFIVESIIICLIGGFIGIILGVGAGRLASLFLKKPTLPPISSIIIAVTFSMIIGIFFGYYPANKAAKLNPIDALRYE